MPRGDPNFGKRVKSPGRPPKAKTNAEAAKKANSIFAAAAPELAEELVKLAKRGDRQALMYCLDRALGKPPEKVEHQHDIFVSFLQELVQASKPQIEAPATHVIDLPADGARALPDGGAASAYLPEGGVRADT
jgi:hypothetical protein